MPVTNTSPAGAQAGQRRAGPSPPLSNASRPPFRPCHADQPHFLSLRKVWKITFKQICKCFTFMSLQVDTAQSVLGAAH